MGNPMGAYSASVKFNGWINKFLDPKFGTQLISDRYVRDASDRITNAVKDEAPIGTHFDQYGNPSMGGDLRDSIYSVTYHQKGGVQIMIKSNLDYALFVTKGTQAHDINANGRMLSFWWDNMGANFPIGAWRGQGAWAGNPYMGKGDHVFHPGITANPFPMDAWNKIASQESGLFLQQFRANFG